MTKESAIQKAQQASLAKFAQERDVFIENPELKEYKAEITLKICGCLALLDNLDSKKKRLKNDLFELDTQIKELTATKQYLAQTAYELQNKGIFWAEKEFSIKKPQEPKLDQQAMFNALTPEQQEKYITRTKKIVEIEETTIDWDKLITNEPKLYTKPLPQIAHKTTKETQDHDYE